MTSESPLPRSCPSCGHILSVVGLQCTQCATRVDGTYRLPAFDRLGDEDAQFLLDFVKCSGSLKELAGRYGISYPTVRNRLDVLIERLERLEAAAPEEETR